MAKKKQADSSQGATRASSRSTKPATAVSPEPMLYGRKHFSIMLGGALLMGIGYLLMMGGDMPDSNTWDDSIIYSFRRTVAAPFVILAGIGLEIYAIFKK